MSRIWQGTVDQFVELAKALSSDIRVEIFKQIQRRPLNVNEISEMFNLPPSTATVNIRKLEEAGLIQTRLVPGTRGTQKICSSLYDRLVVDVTPDQGEKLVNHIDLQVPIGQYVDCQMKPTCGLAGADGLIGYLDDPRSFFEPQRMEAQLLWFRQGYVEYRLPNRIPYDSVLTALEISAELCSEAPGHHPDWPSDITLWVNGVEVGTWLCPGDFGGERGLLTPEWWETGHSQYGLLKKWRVTPEGTCLDGMPLSAVTLAQLGVDRTDSFSVRIGVKEDAANVGGVNLFGQGFGNYDQDLVVRFSYAPKSAQPYT